MNRGNQLILLRSKIASIKAKLDKNVKSRSTNPGDLSESTRQSLKDLEEILTHFEQNYLDKNGNFIKFNWWKVIWNGDLRRKITNSFDFIIEKAKDIIDNYRHI